MVTDCAAGAVVSQHQRRPAGLGNDVGHRERLAVPVAPSVDVARRCSPPARAA